ncbi:ABC transporter ATP-binding protein [Mycoplasma sp. 1018B]|uniref:ABC transporter ATP-binding protein n=1 Tax=Mycoplasma sp. 1018B TaxID=2967302 RepID=UPI00211C3D8B|nr:ABC transporter ATP-binding protein [Mycoplasma sp. 1018B]UUM19003.1 ABC transporter ATP-binding protein/permease [Mycoplasma sp. 1018B]
MLKIIKLLTPKLKFIAILTMFLSLLQPFLSTIIPSITKVLISLATQTQENSLPIIRIIFWNIEAKSYHEAIWMVILLTIIFAVLLMIVSYSASILAWNVAIQGIYQLRKRLFHKLIYLKQNDIDQFSEGTIISRFTNDMQKLKQGLNTLVRHVLVSPSFIIWGLFFALSTNVYLSISIVIIAPFLTLGAFLVLKKLMPLYIKENITVDQLNNTARDDLSGIAVIKSYNLENKRLDNYKMHADNSRNTSLKVNIFSATAWPLLDLISILGNVILFLIIGILIKLNALGTNSKIIGEIYQFSTYLTMVTNSIFFTLFTINRLLRSQTAVKRYFEILNLETNKNNNANFLYDNIESASIEFKNVSFVYKNVNTKKETIEKNALKNLNFKIEHGQKIAIIGKTGSGKSTLAKLLTKEYLLTEQQGEILVDNKNINQINTVNYLKNISHIYQKPKLISGSIKDNLLLVNNEINQNNISKNLDISASNFVWDLNNQLDYELTQGAKNLSGGQRQRLSIAQALGKEFKILIIDDATSALDNETDQIVRSKILTNYPDTTLIIIAQRINAIKEADKIIVLNNGQMVGFGTHDELLKNNIHYQEIYASQQEKGE